MLKHFRVNELNQQLAKAYAIHDWLNSIKALLGIPLGISIFSTCGNFNQHNSILAYSVNSAQPLWGEVSVYECQGGNPIDGDGPRKFYLTVGRDVNMGRIY